MLLNKRERLHVWPIYDVILRFSNYIDIDITSTGVETVDFIIDILKNVLR